MDLKDFVSQTLIQIVQGAADAAEAVEALGGAVSPAHQVRAGSEMLGLVSDESGRQAQAVKFDVGILVETDSTIKGGGGIKVMSFQVGGSLSEGDRHQHTSRIQFVIPLALPVDYLSHNATNAIKDRNRRKITETIDASRRSTGG